VVPLLVRVRRALPHVGPVARRRIAAALLAIGVLLLAEVAVTALWEEPLTAYLTSNAQADLSKQLGALERTTAGGGVPTQLASLHTSNARMSLLAQELSRTTPAGNALGDLQIPRIGIDYVVVQGTGAPALRKGPGHYMSTALPGEGGTMGMAGHRTTYEAPFRDIDQLKRGDRIVLKMPYGLFTYSVTGHRIVANGVSLPTGGGDSVVLSACHPRFSASHRILVSATLLSKQPLGAAVVPSTSAPAKQAPRTPNRSAARLAALGSRELQQGTRGPDVKELQRLLGVPSTGYFGYDTQAAVIAFQQTHHITPADGQVGSRTKKSIARRQHPPSTPPTPASVAPQNNQTTTQQGTTTTPSPQH
jgi:sortase A